MSSANLESFLDLARSRRAARHYDPAPLPDGVLESLLEAARWAPSGYNLQPTHFVVVSDPATKGALRTACFNQAQVTQAPAVVVFAGDRLVARRHFHRVLAADRAAGAIDDRYEQILRGLIPLAFGTGPLGIGWLGKACVGPIMGLIKPTPSIPAVHRRYWLAKQASLAAMTFMLAAEAAGLATCPMEGFDERRVRRALGMPRSIVPVVLVPVGRPVDGDLTKTRLPLDDLVHHERWSGDGNGHSS